MQVLNANLTNPFLRRLVWYLRLTIVVAIILAISFRQWETSAFSVLSLGLSFLPVVIERRFRVSLPVEFELVIVAFIYASIFLGEIGDAYHRFFWWDAVLHTASGAILAYTGFLLFYIMVKRRDLHVNGLFIGVSVFSIALAFGAVWEIFEFAMDEIFGFNMQKSGLVDTMWDLIVDAIGALIMAFIAGRYIKNGGVGWVRRLTAKFMHENRGLFVRGEK